MKTSTKFSIRKGTASSTGKAPKAKQKNSMPSDSKIKADARKEDMGKC